MKPTTNLTEGITNIVKILRDTNIHQIKGSLIAFVSGEDTIEGKCAMGVVSCEVGLPLGRKSIDHPTFNQILERAGIPNEYITLDFPFPRKHWAGEVNEHDMQLHYQIIELNDRENYNFNEIADYLETTFIPEV